MVVEHRLARHDHPAGPLLRGSSESVWPTVANLTHGRGGRSGSTGCGAAGHRIVRNSVDADVVAKRRPTQRVVKAPSTLSGSQLPVGLRPPRVSRDMVAPFTMILFVSVYCRNSTSKSGLSGPVSRMTGTGRRRYFWKSLVAHCWRSLIRTSYPQPSHRHLPGWPKPCPNPGRRTAAWWLRDWKASGSGCPSPSGYRLGNYGAVHQRAMIHVPTMASSHPLLGSS